MTEDNLYSQKEFLKLMQEKGLFLTADGVYATGPVRRPTQYMDLMQHTCSFHHPTMKSY